MSSPTPDQARRDGYEISTDPDRLDRETIHAFLRTAYWSPGIEREVVDRGIDGSIPFGLYGPDGEQAGFARAVTDGATFAWIADVFVLEPHRGRGLGVWIVSELLDHPADAGAARRDPRDARRPRPLRALRLRPDDRGPDDDPPAADRLAAACSDRLKHARSNLRSKLWPGARFH